MQVGKWVTLFVIFTDIVIHLYHGRCMREDETGTVHSTLLACFYCCNSQFFEPKSCFPLYRIVTYRSIFFCVEVIGSTLGAKEIRHVLVRYASKTAFIRLKSQMHSVSDFRSNETRSVSLLTVSRCMHNDSLIFFIQKC